MDRIETVCTRCRQVNVRYGGWARILNPRWAEVCTLCGTPLDGSPRDAFHTVRGPVTWAVVYFLHAFVGAGLIMLVTVVAWPEIINRPWFVRVTPVIGGVALGLILAERSRRAGTLLAMPRRRT